VVDDKETSHDIQVDDDPKGSEKGEEGTLRTRLGRWAEMHEVSFIKSGSGVALDKHQ
jgi:hypothetical protein